MYPLQAGYSFGFKVDGYDSQTSAEVAADDPITSSSDDGVPASQGNQYLYLYIGEKYSGTGEYYSSAANFELEAADNTVIAESTLGKPPSWTGTALNAVTLPGGAVNRGWIGFEIPLGDGAYSLLWQPPLSQQWRPVAALTIPAHSEPSISPDF